MNLDQSNLDLLPPEILTGVLLNLSPADLFHFCSTSSRSNQYCLDEKFWKDKFKHDYPQKAASKPGNTSWKDYYRYTFSGRYSPISAGDKHYGIIKNGRAWMGGDNNYGQRGILRLDDRNKLNKLSFESPVVQVDCNGNSTGVVTKDGKAYVFGIITNLNRKIGSSYLNRKIESNKLIKFISINNISYAVIFEDGSIQFRFRQFTWEINDITARYVYVPLLVKIIGMGIIDEEGTLFIYYIDSENGKISGKRKINMPEPISFVKFYGFDPSYTTYIALSESGNVYTWGKNRVGQAYFSNVNQPTKVNLPKIISIDHYESKIGGAVAEDGRVFVWGNISGRIVPTKEINQLVQSKYSKNSSPIEISVSSERITNISIGEEFMITLTESGKINMIGDGLIRQAMERERMG